MEILKLQEEEFRSFIADLDNIFKNNYDELLKIRVLSKIDKYKDILNRIDHNSSNKFKQLKIDYGK